MDKQTLWIVQGVEEQYGSFSRSRSNDSYNDDHIEGMYKAKDDDCTCDYATLYEEWGGNVIPGEAAAVHFNGYLPTPDGFSNCAGSHLHSYGGFITANYRPEELDTDPRYLA